MSCERPIDLGVFTQGEIPAPLRYTFLDFDGLAIDLTAGYTAKFNWWLVGQAAVTGNASVIAPPTGGLVEYVWTGAEFLTPGRHEAQFWVGNGGANRFASVKIRWVVQSPVGTAPAI